MAERVTIEIPEELGTLLKQVVQVSGETVDAVLLDWLIHPAPELPPRDYQELIDNLGAYTSIQLWTLLEKSLEKLKRVADELSGLTQKSKATNLSGMEQSRSDNLADLYDIYILIRTEAMAELQERGYDLKAYLKRNAPEA